MSAQVFTIAALLAATVQAQTPTCPSATPFISTSNTCIAACPSDQVVDLTTNRCETSCGTNEAISSTDVNGVSRKCVCTANFEASGTSCVQRCQNQFIEAGNSVNCLASCPATQFIQAGSNKCVTGCAATEVVDLTTNQCEASCGTNEAISSTDVNGVSRKCVCTANFEASGTSCVQRCQNQFIEAGNSVNCLASCPATQFIQAGSNKCVTGCAATEVVDLTTNQCEASCGTNEAISSTDVNGVFRKCVCATNFQVSGNGCVAAAAVATARPTIDPLMRTDEHCVSNTIRCWVMALIMGLIGGLAMLIGCCVCWKVCKRPQPVREVKVYEPIEPVQHVQRVVTPPPPPPPVVRKVDTIPLQQREQQQRAALMGNYIAENQRLGTREMTERLALFKPIARRDSMEF